MADIFFRVRPVIFFFFLPSAWRLARMTSLAAVIVLVGNSWTVAD